MKSTRARKGWEDGVLGEAIGYHIARAEVTSNLFYARHIGDPLGLRPVEYSLLMLLLANGELSPKQLTQALSLAAPTLTMLVDRLHERGLIERQRSETDRRSQRVLLTAQGRALAEQAAAASPALNAAFDPLLSPGEQLMLTELLKKIADHRPQLD